MDLTDVVSRTLDSNHPDQSLSSESGAKQANGVPASERSLGTNGTKGSEVPLSNGHASKYETPFNPLPAYAARRMRVITIGAGFSGLMLAHKFQHYYPEMQKYVTHTIFEQNDQIGGTWLANTYPGVQCDVPSHIYVR